LEQHELSGLVYLGAQVDRHSAEVRHLQGDLGVEPRVDFRSRHVDGQADSSPAASALDESHQIAWNPDSLERLCKNELARIQTELILLVVLP
jgi:hypothetical protein